MARPLAEIETDLKNSRETLTTVLESLELDPTNTELLELKSELEQLIPVFENDLSEAKEQQTGDPNSPNASAPTRKDKWSKDGNSSWQRKSQHGSEDSSSTKTAYKVNDMVLARWVSGDKGYWPAKITAITGSSASPFFNVKFQSYDDTEQNLRESDIRPIQPDSKKRKADGTPAVSTVPSTNGGPSNPSVISAAANINPDLANQVRKEPSKVSDGPPRPPKIAKKIKANKELEGAKNKWQAFSSKAKSSKKESMFRTGESFNARVGFTGSGNAMRKDPERSRHIYRALDED